MDRSKEIIRLAQKQKRRRVADTIMSNLTLIGLVASVTSEQRRENILKASREWHHNRSVKYEETEIDGVNNLISFLLENFHSFPQEDVVSGLDYHVSPFFEFPESNANCAVKGSLRCFGVDGFRLYSKETGHTVSVEPDVAIQSFVVETGLWGASIDPD